ncbi:MAG: response regulator [Candidatus Saccharimonadales bacterium]
MSRVLLIEPDKPLANIYSSALKRYNYLVTIARTSQEAINMADIVTPNIILLEIQLAGHSGVEFLYEFRSYAEWQSIPILIHTSVPFTELQNSWGLLNEHLGVSGYMYKPEINLERLVTNVNKLVLAT